MKALVITGSRADRNGLEVVHEALLKAGHESKLGTPMAARAAFLTEQFDVAIIGGDRIEILESAVGLANLRIPIAHIAGGDITIGSADDRYRDAITALSDIHFATNQAAFRRLCDINDRREYTRTYITGSPAIDRIKQTPVRVGKKALFDHYHLHDKPTALVCVHPNTSGEHAPQYEAWVTRIALSKLGIPNTSGEHAPQYEAWVTRIALSKLGIQSICLGANADNGQEEVNEIWRHALELKWLTGTFVENVSPDRYYALMTHCDVMVGNSSAMLYEAPCFGLPCVLVGDRQRGRTVPGNVIQSTVGTEAIEMSVKIALTGRVRCENPYGDGHSAPRIVKALEENEWRWKRD